MSNSNASGIMAGKRGLIMGVANESVYQRGALPLRQPAQGAELAFTYQGDALRKRVEPLAASVNSDIVMECDVTDDASMDVFLQNSKRNGAKIDFVVHAIAYSDKEELKGKYVETSSVIILIGQWIFLFILLQRLPPNGQQR